MVISTCKHRVVFVCSYSDCIVRGVWVFPFRYAQEGVVKQAPKAQASRVVWGVLPQKSFILGASEMTRKFGYYFVNIHIRVLVYPEYCQRGQPLLNRLSHKALGKFSATFKLIWFIGYCVSV